MEMDALASLPAPTTFLSLPGQSSLVYTGTEVGSCVGSGHTPPHAVFPSAVFSSPNFSLSKWSWATQVSHPRIRLGAWFSRSMASPCPISGDVLVLGGIGVLQWFPKHICPVLWSESESGWCSPATGRVVTTLRAAAPSIHH